LLQADEDSDTTGKSQGAELSFEEAANKAAAKEAAKSDAYLAELRKRKKLRPVYELPRGQAPQKRKKAVAKPKELFNDPPLESFGGGSTTLTDTSNETSDFSDDPQVSC